MITIFNRKKGEAVSLPLSFISFLNNGINHLKPKTKNGIWLQAESDAETK